MQWLLYKDFIILAHANNICKPSLDFAVAGLGLSTVAKNIMTCVTLCYVLKLYGI